MTIVGKILLFVVLVFSLIWAGLTVNVYVTRTNWANEVKRLQDKVKESADSAAYQRKQAEETLNASAARVQGLQTEVNKLRATNDQLTRNVADAQRQLGDKLTAQQQQIPPDQLLQSNIARLQRQVDLLQGSLSTMEKQLNEATIGAEKSKADAVRAQIDRDAALKRADDLEARLLTLNDQMNDLRSPGGRGGSSRTAAPDGFRATVTRVDGDLVEISLGANAKLQSGAVLSLFRMKPAKYLGTLTITRVDPYGAVGQFSPPPGVTRPGPDARPQTGDTAGVLK